MTRGLTHYWRWHIGLALGVMAAAAVIAGSLVTGDSVRATLAHQADLRLGKVGTAVAAADGFFTEALAAKVPGAVPVLLVQGTVSAPGDGQRANGVNVFGVRDDFWTLGQSGGAPKMDGGLVINHPLAKALALGGSTAGAEVIVRFEKPSLISRDAPLSGESDLTVTLRAPVREVRADEALGAFSLKAQQEPPLNVYLPLSQLQSAADVPGKANLLLSSSGDSAGVSKALAAGLTQEDAGLSWKEAGDQRVLSTSRIFLSPQTEAAARAAFPDAKGVLTYLVNQIQGTGEGVTPYSMATAAPPGTAGLPSEWPDGSVIITQWLADDLGLKTGDSVSISYFRVTRARQLEEASATFPVHAVLPMDHPAVRREWTPDFPGITETENCRDWKPGIPINQSLIRDKDDAYWKERKGTPKIFLTLNDGQKLWTNRFGGVTSLWVPSTEPAEALKTRLQAHLTPADAGLVTVAVKEAAGKAVSQSMDFGALFVSMSAFLIATALLLAVLLFVFGVSQRAGQIGLLRAAGWRPKEVRRLFAAEGLWVAVPSALAGVLLGLLYTRWTLGKLEREWADAALGLKFLYTVRPVTLLTAWAGTLVLSLLAVWLATRRILKARPRDLLSGASLSEASKRTAEAAAVSPRRWRMLPMGVMTLGGLTMLYLTRQAAPHVVPMLFFGAAALVLADGLRLLAWQLRRTEEAVSEGGVPGLWRLGVRNAVRRRGRSMAMAGLLASGIFMVVALNAFRQDATLTPSGRDTGTGGFALIGTSTLPVYEDLNSPSGRAVWDLETKETAGVEVVPFRARDGEEASCLNLNRAQTPRVLGVDPRALASLEAFTFAGLAPDMQLSAGASPWTMLNLKPTDGTVPAIMDQYSAMFALGKKVGDIITVPDGQGNPVNLRLAALLGGTVLQGNVIIGDAAFVKLYPDSGGFRYFLADASPEQAKVWSEAVMRQLANRGLSVMPAAERLAQYQAVQNTYLTIFSTLGGLALILSTVGLGVLVARQVLERKAEFALLQAVGFKSSQLRTMVLAEHWFLFLAAVILGTGTALLAVWPNLKLAGTGGMPVRLLATLLTGLVAGGLIFCQIAARLALGRQLNDSLRHE
ncbi:MAG: FtsX-like permease family protein [Verrucomicrobiales bacterium]|nr:FtsX-like permease family protein [Verrucomicrobiales bacterium]